MKCCIVWYRIVSFSSTPSRKQASSLRQKQEILCQPVDSITTITRIVSTHLVVFGSFWQILRAHTYIHGAALTRYKLLTSEAIGDTGIFVGVLVDMLEKLRSCNIYWVGLVEESCSSNVVDR